jgi:hypothetical protein
MSSETVQHPIILSNLDLQDLLALSKLRIWNNNNNTIYLLIHAGIPSDRNVIQKESKKKLKYKNSSIEIQRMWNMKCFVIPVIIGATGIVTRGLKIYLDTTPGKHSIDSLQKYSCTRNITSSSATIRNLNPEWWGSPLVQEQKYQEKPVKR